MRKIIFLSIFSLFFLALINISSAADCKESTNGYWRVGNCPLPNYALTTSVINKKKTGNGPSPYITTVISSSPEKSNGEYRAQCPGERMIDSSDGKRESSCKKEIKKIESCTEKSEGGWIMGNCPVIGPADSVIYAVNTKVLGNGPSPYIKNVKSDNPKKDNGNYRVKCSGERMIDTSDGKRESSCKSEIKERYEDIVGFDDITYNSFFANWEKDNSAKKYSYKVKDINGLTIKSGDVTTNYININGLKQGTSYTIQIISRNGNSVLGTYYGETKTFYSEGPTGLSKITSSSSSVYVHFEPVNGADRYKLDIYRSIPIESNNQGGQSEYEYSRIGGIDYASPRNTDRDCLNQDNIGTLNSCNIEYSVDGYGKLNPASRYKVKITAYKGRSILTTFEGTFWTSEEKKGLEFSDIEYDGFSFSWEYLQGVDRYYYDIYDKTNKEKIIEGMYDDSIKLSYNTKTGKYKDWFSLKPSTTYIVTVNGYSNEDGRYKIIFSGEVITKGDNINVLSENTKKYLDSLISKIKNKFLSDESSFDALIEDINKEIDYFDSSSNTGKSSILKANYLKDKLNEIIKTSNYIKLENKGIISFNNIEKDGFTIKRKDVGSTDNYYIAIYDKTANNKKLISGMYEDKPLTYSYNTKTGKYKNWFKINECNYYRVNLDYYDGEVYKKTYSHLITKGCEGIEDDIIGSLYSDYSQDFNDEPGTGGELNPDNNDDDDIRDDNGSESSNGHGISIGNETDIGDETNDSNKLSSITKLSLNNLILKIKNKFLSNKNSYKNLISKINNELGKINSNTPEGEYQILKTKFIYDKLTNIINNGDYVKVKNQGIISFTNIEEDGFIININNTKQINDYFLSIYDNTNNYYLITGLNNKTFDSPYTINTISYNNFFSIDKCINYKVFIYYINKSGIYEGSYSDIITKGCNEIENELLESIYIDFDQIQYEEANDAAQNNLTINNDDSEEKDNDDDNEKSNINTSTTKSSDNNINIESINKTESNTLRFANIESDGFTFFWNRTTGVDKYYYDIYNKTNRKYTLKGMYNDNMLHFYNTKTGKYKNWNSFHLTKNTTYLVSVNGYSEKEIIVSFSGEVTTKDNENVKVSLNENTDENLEKESTKELSENKKLQINKKLSSFFRKLEAKNKKPEIILETIDKLISKLSKIKNKNLETKALIEYIILKLEEKKNIEVNEFDEVENIFKSF